MAHGSRKQGRSSSPLQAPGRERPSSPAFSTEEEKASGTKGNALFQVHAIHGTFWKNGGAH
ncbi:hypothetical protein C5O11_10420 [Akkermansia muciniphila]|nr:hypothetical protein C5O11_10420 [Akkermansia muciniphila]